MLNSNNYDSVIQKIKTKSYQIIYRNSSYTQWKTVGVFSLDENKTYKLMLENVVRALLQIRIERLEALEEPFRNFP